jgi:hypothetical protein
MNMAHTFYRFVHWSMLPASVVFNNTISLRLRSMQAVHSGNFIFCTCTQFDLMKIN